MRACVSLVALSLPLMYSERQRQLMLKKVLKERIQINPIKVSVFLLDFNQRGLLSVGFAHSKQKG